jgi:hypothetical protein
MMVPLEFPPIMIFRSLVLLRIILSRKELKLADLIKMMNMASA